MLPALGITSGSGNLRPEDDLRGLIWTLVLWGGLFAALRLVRHRHWLVANWFSRENIALVVALLGTYSIAAQADAAAVLEQPVVAERVVRGSFSILAIALVAPMLISRLRGYVPGHRAIAGLVAYLGVAAVSTIYSAAPLVTAAKVGELTAGLAPILAIALGPDAARRLRSTLLMVLTMVITLQVVAVVGFFAAPSVFARVQTRPGFLIQQTLVSPYAHGNTIAAHGALITVFSAGMYFTHRRGRQLWVMGGLIGVAAIVLSSGRQGVAMAVAGLIAVLWARKRALFLGLLGPGVGALVFANWDALYTAIARNRPENLTNFTGRLYWWEAALEAWSAHPWTGWGYTAGGRFVALASLGRGRTSSVHSGFVEALVGVGILGLAALLYTVYCVVAWSLRNLTGETALAVLIIPLVLRTSVSTGFGGGLSIEFALFALLAAISDRARIDRRDASPSRRELDAVAVV